MHLSVILLLFLHFNLFHISQCTTFFPANSAYGLFAAIAVPLDLPHYNVFVSYNFEANYNLPQTWGIPPALEGIEDEDLFDSEVRLLHECSNCTDTTSTQMPTNTTTRTTTTAKSSRAKKIKKSMDNRDKRSLLTRTYFYEILKHKFEMSGYKGESCLLRLICETNASSLGEMNGVLGSLVHILFAPSTSMNEQLPLQFYQAELDGAHELCEHYAADCSENILDFISSPLHEIINQLAK